jgi:TRAP-type uncharacterized transport system fused permease subunit
MVRHYGTVLIIFISPSIILDALQFPTLLSVLVLSTVCVGMMEGLVSYWLIRDNNKSWENRLFFRIKLLLTLVTYLILTVCNTQKVTLLEWQGLFKSLDLVYERGK